MQQQHIYMQSNENFEVITTVFSPQVIRSRTRHRCDAPEKMVVKHSYKPLWPDELALTQGDAIVVLFKHEESRWYGRLPSGQQGYFPASHVTELIQKDEPPKESGVSLRRKSDGAVLTGRAVEASCSSAPPPGSPSLRRRLSLRCGEDGGLHSPRLLHKILSRNRRRSESHGTHNVAFEPD